MWDQCYSGGYCDFSKIFILIFYIHTYTVHTYIQVTPDANPINPRKFCEEALKRFHDQLSEYIRPKERGYSNQYICMYVCTVLENYMYWCLKIVFVCTSKDEILCFVTTCINMIYCVCMYVCTIVMVRVGMGWQDWTSNLTEIL